MASWPSDSVRTKNWGTETLTDTDLEAQLDVLHAWVNDALDETSGHKHDGTSNEGPKINLSGSNGVKGVLPIVNGGTGQSTLAGLLNLVYPVGSIYANASDATNPGTLLGFGTWVAIEEEVIAGFKAGGTFDPVGTLSEGEETHTLILSESPSHDHARNGDLGDDLGAGGLIGYIGASTGGAIDTSMTEEGGDGAHNNLQPTYVAYLWRRTA